MEQIKMAGIPTTNEPIKVAEGPALNQRADFYFNLRSRKLTRIQLVGVVVLLCLHVFAYIVYTRLPERGFAQNLVTRFGLDRDGNVPTLFSAFLLFFAGLLLYLVYKQAKARQEKKAFSYWFVLSMIFFFLGVDEATMIHEFTTGMIRSATGNKLPVYLKHAWIIPYAFLLLVAAVHYAKFLLHLPARTRRQFIVAGVVYVGSAMGMELFEGAELSENGHHSLFLLQMQTVEEILEMLAIIYFNFSLMQYLGSKRVQVGLQVG